MLLAVEHCHQNGILHRDIKLENFLVSRDVSRSNPFGLSVKLTDFGLSCNYDPNDPPSHYCGTVTSMAPEIIKGIKYGPKIDSWSLGVALFELFTDHTPFEGSRNMVKAQILNREVVINPDEFQTWETVDEAPKDLIRKLMHKDPTRRLSPSEALRHEWFRDFNELEILYNN